MIEAIIARNPNPDIVVAPGRLNALPIPPINSAATAPIRPKIPPSIPKMSSAVLVMFSPPLYSSISNE